jgi:hypothetical protein
MLAFSLPLVAQSVRIPFTQAGSLMLVNVSVNGQEKTLIFDTGAERTIVNERNAHVERRGTSVSSGNYACIMPVIFIDMGDAPVNVSRTVGRAHADGVLGQDLLAHFRSVRIDYKNHVIELSQ